MNTMHNMKRNMKNIQLIHSLNKQHPTVNKVVTEVIDLSKQGFEATQFREFRAVEQCAKKLLRWANAENYLQSQIYVMKIDKLVDSVLTLGNRLSNEAFPKAQSLATLSRIKESIHQIGVSLSEVRGH